MSIRVLGELYLRSLPVEAEMSPIDRAIKHYLEGGEPDLFELSDALKDMTSDREFLPPEVLDYGRTLLALNLLCAMHQPLHPLQALLYKLVQRFRHIPTWKEFQLSSALGDVNALLRNVDGDLSNPKQSQSGAIPLEWGGHWDWATSPHAHAHAEQGLLWAIIGKLSGTQHYLQAALRGAQWLLNTLDGQYFPMQGLYVQEASAALDRQLILNYLYFHAVAKLCDQGQFAYLAQRQLGHIQNLASSHSIKVPLHLAMIERWIEKEGADVAPHFTPLNELICDPNTALVGYRNAQQSAVCSLVGGNTGLGHFAYKDVAILAYGPQQFPIEDCSCFGVEQACTVNHNHLSNVSIDLEEKDFRLEGRVRIRGTRPNLNTFASYGNTKPSGVWMNAIQEFRSGKLSLMTSFYGVNSLSESAFSFFVKASQCVVDQSHHLNKQSLDLYSGDLASICFESEQAQLQISPRHNRGEMQVLPLGGSGNFWGADYLVSFYLATDPQTYHWELTPSDRRS